MFIMQENLVTERKERPVSMNAFELISRSPSFNLENLFEKQTVCMIFHFLFMNISIWHYGKLISHPSRVCKIGISSVCHTGALGFYVDCFQSKACVV